MSQKLEFLLPRVWRYRDSVNVYVLQWEDGSVGLFDLGSGEVLAAMEAAGLPQPELVMHTDYRRDRTFGHYDHPGLKVALGAPDVPYMANATERWRQVQVLKAFGNYEDFWMPRESIPVAMPLHDGQLVVWRKPYVYAQHLGAHTPGAMGYLILHGDRKLLVGGDILQEGGTVASVFELQRNYNFMEGLHALRRAAGWLASGDVDGVLPSHGEPILGTEAVATAAQRLLSRLPDFWQRWRLMWPDQPQQQDYLFDPVPYGPQGDGRHPPSPDEAGRWAESNGGRLLPHLRYNARNIQYAIVADDGHALLFDTGVSWSEDSAKVLAEKGIRHVDAVIITHHHYDHVMAYDWLKRQYNTRLMAHEAMVDILEHPTAYALNCLWDRPLKVDTVLREGEAYEWREYRIIPHHFPSQDAYHAVYFCEVDGVQVLFSGDALYWEPGLQRLRPTNPDWRNRFDVDTGYLKGAPLLSKYQPRLLAAAHVFPTAIRPEACEAFADNARAFHDSLRALVGRNHPTLGIDPFFLSIYPYQLPAKETMHAEVRACNPLDRPTHVSLTPRLPAGVRARPEVLEVTLGPKEEARVPVTLRAETVPSERVVWTLRVVFDGEDLGEFCEGMMG